MREPLLPVAEAKSINTSVSNITFGWVIKLLALIALLITAGAAIGLYCFQMGSFSIMPDITQVTSSYTVRHNLTVTALSASTAGSDS